MAIVKCGSCGQFHQSVIDVRKCFNRELVEVVPEISQHSIDPAKLVGKRIEVHVERPSVPATDKQKAYIVSLLNDRVWDGDDFEVETITKDQASGIIGKLKSCPVKATKQTHIVVGFVAVPVKGKFTVVWPNGHRTTYRFKVPSEGNFKDKIMAGYLAGPDNDSDYINFGNAITAQTVRVWNRFTEESMLVEGLRFLLGSKEAQFKAGEMYAIESGNCWRCGRTLTVPASVARGLGPDCAQQLGVA